MFFKKVFLKKFKNKLKKYKNHYDLKLKNEKEKIYSILNHDIKTPILAQNQSLELLLKGVFGDLTENQEKIIKEIYYSNNFLLEVVLNSIFLSNFENEKLKPNLESVDIISQIEDCCEMMRIFASEKQQKFIIKNKAKNIKLDADRKMIQKII